MTKRITMTMAAVLAACGPNLVAAPDGAAGGIDAGRADAATPPGGTNLPVNCVDYMLTVTNANNSRSEQTNRWATISEIGPGDRFMTRYCVPTVANPYAQGCPSGATCAGTVAPAGRLCYQTDTGTFIAGALVVMCGYESRYFDAGGSMTGETVVAYEDVTVTKL